jgi:octaprenyl-diphosphate synthase
MLFQAASQTAVVLVSRDEALITARGLRAHVGIGYQLVDDWLDYAGDPAVMGKNAGDDLAEGKLTLPPIHTLRHGSSGETGVDGAFRSVLQATALADVIVAVKRCGALDRTRRDAEVQAQRAIELLATIPSGKYRDALTELARFCVSRLN